MLLRVYSNRFLRNHTGKVVLRVLHAENFLLMHIVPWSEDDLKQLSNCGQFVFPVSKVMADFKCISWILYVVSK